jgi:protein-tyrosine phosphatase
MNLPSISPKGSTADSTAAVEPPPPPGPPGAALFDLHCHILPGVDDGAQSLEEALAMARFYVADGVTCIVATPHCHRYIHLLRSDIIPAVARFNEQLRTAEIPLTVLPGSEIQVVDSTEYRNEFERGDFCHLGDGREFTLLEFNWQRELFPSDAEDLIRWICAKGMTPILAHPERHNFFWEDVKRLDGLVAAGAWLQVTVDSLIGNHGIAPSQAGGELLRRHREIILASDAHNLKRCSGMTVGYQWVREHEGDDRADDLLRRSDWIRSRIEQSATTRESPVDAITQ